MIATCISGISLKEGFLLASTAPVEEETLVLQGSATRGNVKRVVEKKQIDTWTARVINDCIDEAVHFKN